MFIHKYYFSDLYPEAIKKKCFSWVCRIWLAIFSGYDDHLRKSSVLWILPITNPAKNKVSNNVKSDNKCNSYFSFLEWAKMMDGLALYKYVSNFHSFKTKWLIMANVFLFYKDRMLPHTHSFIFSFFLQFAYARKIWFERI